MKKPIFPRIIGLAMTYVGVFILLVVIQFANRRSFSLRIGDVVISGNYGAQETGAAPQGNTRSLAGGASVLYGGMEFFLTDNDDGDSLGLMTRSGSREPARPVDMTVSNDTALFRLSGGAEISFANRQGEESQELRIVVRLPETCQALELPYRLLRSSRIRRNAGGESYVIAGGKSYRLNASTVDFERSLIVIDIREPVASYGAVQSAEGFDPSRSVLASARDPRRYDETLNLWLDRSFALWRASDSGGADEETTLAYLAESARRGSYQAAVAALSPEFSPGTSGTFMPSVYMGRMDQGLRSSMAYERENFSRLSRLIAEGSADFLRDPHVIEFLAVRGYDDLIDSGVAIARTLDHADPGLDLIPGILEGYADWLFFRPSEENPFEDLADQACFSLPEKILPSHQGERVLVFDGSGANLEFNSRLGAGMIAYGEHTGQELYTGIGRSLVLSVLAFVDESGTAPLLLRLEADGEIAADTAAVLSSARIYRLLRIGDYAARAVSLYAAPNNVWTLTAAAGVTANFNQETNMLDISVNFPRGETHYMFIRGIRPFVQIRLYNIPFRTDPRFESYDSSGWAYSPSEQTLMVKMKHQLSTEHIQIYY
jgi:hypothetical protein